MDGWMDGQIDRSVGLRAGELPHRSGRNQTAEEATSGAICSARLARHGALSNEQDH